MSHSNHLSLEDELLRQLAGQVVHSPVPVFVSMCLIGFMAIQQVPELSWACGAWILAVLIMQGVRVVIFQRLPFDRKTDIRRRLRTATAINTANTLLHSLSFAMFPLFTPYQAAVQSMLFIAMGVASITTTAGYLPFTVAHIAIGLMPLFGLWAWSGLFGSGGTIALVVSLVGIGYSLSLFFIAKRIFAAFKESIQNRQQLQLALQAAESASRSKTRFLAAASHDLRQPIHTLSLFSAALDMQDLNDKSRHIASHIDSAVQALTYQLDSLLDISKLDAGVVPVRKTSFDLRDTLDWLAEEFGPIAQKRNISLRWDCNAGAIVRTDAALLERILNNLISNAINHNTDCSVTVSVKPQNRAFLLSVVDSGCGIPKEQQKRVFEEFYQVKNPERDRSKGLGLGLAIVSRMAGLLGLELKFSSAPGKGTKFRITIPMGSTDIEERQGLDKQQVTLDSLAVLVVDDEPSVCEGMKVLLENFGCSVLTADGTASALTAARAKKPDLALLDLRLRNQDSGLIALDSLRALHPELPAIFISGDTGPERLKQAQAAGIPLLNKPVLCNPLREAIGRACNIEE